MKTSFTKENLNNSLARGEAAVSSMFLNSADVLVKSLFETNFRTDGLGVAST